MPLRLSHRQIFTCTSHLAFHCGSTTTAGPDLLTAKRRACTRLFSGQGDVTALVKVRTRSPLAAILRRDAGRSRRPGRLRNHSSLCASVRSTQSFRNRRRVRSAVPPADVLESPGEWAHAAIVVGGPAAMFVAADSLFEPGHGR